MQLWWWKKFACHKTNKKKTCLTSIRGYLTLSIANLQLCSACLSARCYAKLDMLAPLVIMDLKHHLQRGFVESMGLSLLSATLAKYFHISESVCFFKKPRTVGRSTHATFRHVSLALLSDCHRETMPTLAAGSEEAEISCTHRHTAPLSHKVHKVPILIKREKVLLLMAGYRGTFLVTVYHATLLGTQKFLPTQVWFWLIIIIIIIIVSLIQTCLDQPVFTPSAPNTAVFVSGPLLLSLML